MRIYEFFWNFSGLSHYSPLLWYNYHDWRAIGYLTTKLGGGAMENTRIFLLVDIEDLHKHLQIFLYIYTCIGNFLRSFKLKNKVNVIGCNLKMETIVGDAGRDEPPEPTQFTLTWVAHKGKKLRNDLKLLYGLYTAQNLYGPVRTLPTVWVD